MAGDPKTVLTPTSCAYRAQCGRISPLPDIPAPRLGHRGRKKIMTPHTPAPWHFGVASREIWGDGKNIAKIGPGMLYGFHAPTVTEQDANARLIAASPDLLAALQALIAISDDDRAETQNARAAIAKAGGQS